MKKGVPLVRDKRLLIDESNCSVWVAGCAPLGGHSVSGDGKSIEPTLGGI